MLRVRARLHTCNKNATAPQSSAAPRSWEKAASHCGTTSWDFPARSARQHARCRELNRSLAECLHPHDQ